MKISKDKVELWAARREMGITMVARRAGLNLNTFFVALGRGSCGAATAGKIATALDVDVSEITSA